MPVDIRGLEIALVQTVRQYIGSKLSTIGTGGNEKASVIRSRLYSQGTPHTTPTFPDYPYASVDYTRLSDEGYELTERTFDENENYIYTAHKLASYSISFYGTSQNDVMSLCNEMHMMLEVDEVRELIHTKAPTEARVRSKTDPVFVASSMEDKYREVATFDLILAVLDQITIPAGSTVPIENVQLNTSIAVDGVQGGIYREEDDTSPLNVDVVTAVTYP